MNEIDTFYTGRKICYKSIYPTVSIGGKNIRVHMIVWEEVNGVVPKGYRIHHKDGNPLNFDINNLECMSSKDHRRIHAGWIKNNGVWSYKPCSRRWK